MLIPVYKLLILMVLVLCSNRYTWQIYSERLLTLTGVYGFWKHVSNLDRRESRRYLEMFYALKYRKLVKILCQTKKLEMVKQTLCIISDVWYGFL